ncbi:MAG: type II toxin-antitoxin system RelE/ParE family toxin [Clostridiaceae bacterium]|jgi:plasmid stabilization system protein ParE|nr:type II toxin-antitoxin system RelE/ParE family toxin [Clostridiaceae bacterium]
MKRIVILTEPANDDLKDIVAYIAADNIVNALRIHDKIMECLHLLENNPGIGVYPKSKKLRNEGYRKLIIDNYVAMYRLSESGKNEIYVIRVFHGAMNYEKYL